MSQQNPFANNPQTFMNSYLSAMRNCFLTTTLGIAFYGFSAGFKNKQAENIMRLLSLVMYVYALLLCLITNLMFTQYIKKAEDYDEPFPDYLNLKWWKHYGTLGYTFCVILGILILLASKRFVFKLFGLQK